MKLFLTLLLPSIISSGHKGGSTKNHSQSHHPYHECMRHQYRAVMVLVQFYWGFRCCCNLPLHHKCTTDFEEPLQKSKGSSFALLWHEYSPTYITLMIRRSFRLWFLALYYNYAYDEKIWIYILRPFQSLFSILVLFPFFKHHPAMILYV